MAEGERRIADDLPRLRRYVRALTGSKRRTDALLLRFLAALASGDPALPRPYSREALFRCFEAWQPPSETRPGDGILATLRFEATLRQLPEPERKAVLLCSLEGFSADAAARILGLPKADLKRLHDRACEALAEAWTERVLIIEDDYMQAADIAHVAAQLGMRVSGMAATVRQAVDLASESPPEIVIADVRLRDGGSGFEAVRRIRDRFDVPVIYVTAYPELLSEHRAAGREHHLEKPFEPGRLATLIERARGAGEARPA